MLQITATKVSRQKKNGQITIIKDKKSILSLPGVK